MITPEGKVKGKLKKILDKYGIWYFVPVSGGYGKHGIPDFVCCANGKFLAIECKAPKKKPTDLQVAVGVDIVMAGGQWLVFDGTNESVENAEYRCKTLTER